MSSPALDRKAIEAEIRAVMTEIIKSTRQQLEAANRGDSESSKSLEAELAKLRSREAELLRLYRRPGR
jgi:hypothetical protein